MKKQGELTRSVKRRSPGGRVLCTAMAVTLLLTQTASAAPWQWHRNELIYDSEIGFFGNVTLTFASDGGSFIRPITKRYGHSISLESYVPTKYGYTFKGWFTDPRTKQDQVTTFEFTKPDVLYAKWEENLEEPINPSEEIMAKDTCYLTDEETKIRTHYRLVQGSDFYCLVRITGVEPA